MSSKIFTPVNQIRFTNVAVVRLKKGGKRFEVACYRNKILDWRNGVEGNLDDVVQTPYVFTNLSRGVVAKSSELQSALGVSTHDAALLLILEQGEVQVSTEERRFESESVYRDVLEMVAERCVDAQTEHPIPVGVLERTLKEAHFSVKPNKSAKQQSMEAIRVLETHPEWHIRRARMRVRVSGDGHGGGDWRRHFVVVEREDATDGSVIGQVDPPSYRPLCEVAGLDVELLTMYVRADVDAAAADPPADWALDPGDEGGFAMEDVPDVDALLAAEEPPARKNPGSAAPPAKSAKGNQKKKGKR